MRLRNLKDADQRMENCQQLLDDGTEYKGKWCDDYFKNQAPMYVEFGMGKGQFLSTHAMENPNKNYIGFEKYAKVMVRALDKFLELDNAALLCTDACQIEDIFEKGEVYGIYLNFSDPWPKDRHARRRLTDGGFLDKYKAILRPNGEVHFKTDNEALFDYSLEQFKEKGWELKKVTRDLHNSEYQEGNVMTEYEERYKNLGQPIYRLEAIAPNND